MNTLKKVLLAIYSSPILIGVVIANLCYVGIAIVMIAILTPWYWLRGELEFGSLKKLLFDLSLPFRLWYLGFVWDVKINE